MRVDENSSLDSAPKDAHRRHETLSRGWVVCCGGDASGCGLRRLLDNVSSSSFSLFPFVLIAAFVFVVLFAIIFVVVGRVFPKDS